MPRYIDADKLHYKKIYVSTGYEETKQAVVVFAKEIDKQESREFVQVVHAHWGERKQDQCYCSNCNSLVTFMYGVDVPYRYCPQCGAIMDEKAEELCEKAEEEGND